MNQETQKQFGMKLLVVSGIGCLVWYLLVKPVQETVETQRLTVESHEVLIEAYNTQIGSQPEGISIEAERQLEEILDAIADAMNSEDSDTSLHSLLNESARQTGISISRIESVNAREVTMKVPGGDQLVKGINQTVRVELDGLYDSVMKFMDQVGSNPIPVKFTSVRLIPVSSDRVRVNAEIESVVLTSVPTSDLTGGLGHE